MPLPFQDAHSHLNDEAFAGDIGQVLERARDAGVDRVVNVGYDEPSTVLALEQAAKYPGLLVTVGLHPHDSSKLTPRTMDFFDSLASDPKVVAVGETGLDYHYMNSPVEAQKEAFFAHLDLAETLKLPVVIHCRKAYPDLIQILEGRSGKEHVPWLVHCFSGGSEDMEELVRLDCYFSIGGTITFTNFKKADLIRRIPDNRLLLETDSPYLAPHPKRGQQNNEPAYLVYTAQAMAKIRGIELEELSRMTRANFERIFNIKLSPEASTAI